MINLFDALNEEISRTAALFWVNGRDFGCDDTGVEMALKVQHVESWMAACEWMVSKGEDDD